jgi:hypothetical protein
MLVSIAILGGKVDNPAHLLAAERLLALSPGEKALIREQVHTLLQDPELRGSRRCKDLLTFIVEEALKGNFHNLKERVIGERVFGRSSTYDTGADAVVRVSANELRKRLAQRYLRSGEELPFQISIPSGSYIPEFQFGKPGDTPVAEPPEIPGEVRPERPRRHAVIALSAALACCLIVILVLGFKLRQLQSGRAAGSLLPWAAVLDDKSRTYIVLGDVAVAAAQDLLHLNLSLDDYVKRAYIPSTTQADPQTMALARLLTTKRHTSVADAELTARIAEVNAFPRQRAIIRFAREMQVDDFKNANAILLDSRRTNPWVGLFENRLNFHLDWDNKLQRHVARNQSPAKGEKSLYIPAGITGVSGEAYAVVALLPNLSTSGFVLIIEGTNTEATEAAGQFAADAARIAEALSRIGIRPDSQPRPFELFLRVDATGGTSSRAELLSYRIPAAR